MFSAGLKCKKPSHQRGLQMAIYINALSGGASITSPHHRSVPCLAPADTARHKREDQDRARLKHGKRGGIRIIYYNTLAEGSIRLLIAYTKAKLDNLPVAFLKQLKEEISNGR